MQYAIESIRRFAGLWLSERLPDETTILNFRRLPDAPWSSDKAVRGINRQFKEQD